MESQDSPLCGRHRHHDKSGHLKASYKRDVRMDPAGEVEAAQLAELLDGKARPGLSEVFEALST